MRGLTPFVGRQKELEHLKDCYEQAQKGQGQVVGIVGEPGVGKSRLLLEFMRYASPERSTPTSRANASTTAAPWPICPSWIS